MRWEAARSRSNEEHCNPRPLRRHRCTGRDGKGPRLPPSPHKVVFRGRARRPSRQIKSVEKNVRVIKGVIEVNTLPSDKAQQTKVFAAQFRFAVSGRVHVRCEPSKRAPNRRHHRVYKAHTAEPLDIETFNPQRQAPDRSGDGRCSALYKAKPVRLSDRRQDGHRSWPPTKRHRHHRALPMAGGHKKPTHGRLKRRPDRRPGPCC